MLNDHFLELLHMLGNTNWWCFDGGSSGQIYSSPCRQSHCTDAWLDWRSVKAQVTDHRVSTEPGKCVLQECPQESLVICLLAAGQWVHMYQHTFA